VLEGVQRGLSQETVPEKRSEENGSYIWLHEETCNSKFNDRAKGSLQCFGNNEEVRMSGVEVQRNRVEERRFRLAEARLYRNHGECLSREMTGSIIHLTNISEDCCYEKGRKAGKKEGRRKEEMRRKEKIQRVGGRKLLLKLVLVTKAKGDGNFRREWEQEK
jgi:hypothetical protein